MLTTPHSQRHHRSRHGLAFALAATIAVTAACGDDAGDDLTLGQAGCDAYARIGSSMFGDPSGLAEDVQTLRDESSTDLGDAATTYGDAVLAAVDGDETAMASADFVTASQNVGAAVFESCATVETLDVHGIDFAFEGLPDELEAGRVAMRFTNDTEHGEAHEMFVVQRAEGFDEPVTALLDMSEDELFANVVPTAVAFADEPGGTNVALVDLEPGSYVAICMIPTEGTGVPHAVNGMVSEFTVV